MATDSNMTPKFTKQCNVLLNKILLYESNNNKNRKLYTIT